MSMSMSMTMTMTTKARRRMDCCCSTLVAKVLLLPQVTQLLVEAGLETGSGTARHPRRRRLDRSLERKAAAAGRPPTAYQSIFVSFSVQIGIYRKEMNQFNSSREPQVAACKHESVPEVLPLPILSHPLSSLSPHFVALSRALESTSEHECVSGRPYGFLSSLQSFSILSRRVQDP
jgi:hypothetical protein